MFNNTYDQKLLTPPTTFPFFVMTRHPPEPEVESWIGIVRQRAGAMRFGSVHIIVHEGRVTQVESTEKTRLAGEQAAASQTRR